MLLRIPFILVLLIGVSGCVQNVRTVTEQDLETFSTTRVYYATNRIDTLNPNLNHRYNGERGQLSFGISTIAIPLDYAKAQKPSFLHWNLQLKRNPKKYLSTLSMTAKDQQAFYHALQRYQTQSALVFIHGFNTPFERVNRIGAKMHYDLGWPGPFILFSWPSRGSATSYAADEANLLWSQADLEQFLTGLFEQTDLQLNLMAHSLGNRALTNVLIDLIPKHPEWLDRINAVILAAPDIDAGYFERSVGPSLVSLGLPVSLYVSANDIALKASKKIHRHPRVGESTERVVIVPGMDTIDASLADAEVFGHEYYYQGPHAIADLNEWLVQGLDASQRTHLKAMESENGRYWLLQPFPQPSAKQSAQ